MKKPAFTFGSLFAGVGGFDLGFERAGGKCLWQVEWDKVAQGVLRRRFPDVPLFGDIQKVKADDLEAPDVICYGFPCQDISQANNKRRGLDGERSGLFYHATRLFNEFARRGSRVRLTVAENVAGLLNVDNGKGLARVLRELAKCGFVSAWATLDAAHFGVPQRRRRVFIVSGSGTERPEKILALTQGLRRNFEKGEKTRKARQAPADFAASARGAGIFTPSQFGQYKTGVGTLRANGGDLGGGSENLAVVDVYNQTEAGKVAPTVTSASGIPNASGPKVVAWNGDETPKHSEGVSVTLRSQQGGEGVGVAYCDQVADPICTRENRTTTNEGSKNFKARNLVAEGLVVRRLTPRETCRLQGFPDDWNAEQVLPDGTVATVSDSQRFKQMGNAVAVPVAEWLGRQIAEEFTQNENAKSKK